MSFLNYNKDFEVKPVGFNNIGFTCYYNALLQSLLSCTSFTEELLSNENEYNTDITLRLIIYLIKQLKIIDSNTDEINRLGPITWRAMIKKIASKSRDFAQFAMGQQCAAEGFSLLLQSVEEFQGIQNLFLHRRRNKLFCDTCSQWFSDISEVNNIFEVEPKLESFDIQELKQNPEHDSTGNVKNLNEFLLNQVGIVDENCICSICKTRSNKIKQSSLVMTPEILFVISKKYKYNLEKGLGEKLDIYTEFPQRLEFKGKNSNVLNYEAVAQIEHISSSINYGHYYSICKRKGGWFCLNDLSVSKSEYKPTNNTYAVLYHIF